MASRSAGTLITHNNATYIPPALMPGYHGHVPTEAFTYGDTYGNTTARCFQDFRSSALSSSQSPYCKGGQFPTSYANDPALVLSSRSRGWDRSLYSPGWSRHNVDYDRTQELNQFRKSAQLHRDHYRDKTGTVPQVPHFILPVKNEEAYPLPQQCDNENGMIPMQTLEAVSVAPPTPSFAEPTTQCRPAWRLNCPMNEQEHPNQ